MGDAEPGRMTVEDYFRLDETSTIRHEYVSGEVYAMSGATARHNRIAGNIFARLLPAARAGPTRFRQASPSSPVACRLRRSLRRWPVLA